jgi:2-hydroxycyclohexanecarboxyl-CoA dehydrogenase
MAKTAVVTGGASGIGRAIALRLARDGADVAILDLDAAGAERVAREVTALGRRAAAVETDVASSASVARAVERVHEALGAAAILVNDAGICSFTPLAQMTEEAWDRMIAVHLKGTFTCTRALMDDMIAARWGRIVNISSVAGIRGAPTLAHYGAAKAGVIGFTQAVALEIGPLGITVNAIAPGLIDTPLLKSSKMPEAMIEYAIGQTAVGRIGLPDDIASAAAWLVSEEASFVTGQVVSPNGGTLV